ncbi:MAG: Maf family nucleotide pyrophosphatase [Candidatus Omnitrophota bacterium]
MIYLASNSKARKKLLEAIGLKFKLLPVKVKEIRKAGGISYAGLVKLNAQRKAAYAAQRVIEGVIIAADTIMVQEDKIYGKPRDLQEARRTLKAMSARAQDVYSGIAVIKKEAGREKMAVGYARTRVYMDKLTDKDINAYFKQVSPLDKAGSYDIQGKGAFFVRKIEGCFYNVVGLPLGKLYLIFKKLDIKFFLFFLYTICYPLPAVFLAGCSTEYNIVTGEQELYYYSTDKEVAMGKAIDREIRKQYRPVDDPLVQKRVEEIGKKIAAICDRKEIDYYFYVIDDDQINAVSLPGGYVYVFKGLVNKVSSDDELAGVIGHEIAHIVARHSIKRLQGQQLYSVLRVLTAAAPGSGDAGTAADMAITQLMLGYSREDELLADQLGARYSGLAGYDPHGMMSFLDKLEELEKKRPLAPLNYFKTHPYAPDRIRTVKQELGKGMDFDDYINIQDEPHK